MLNQLRPRANVVDRLRGLRSAPMHSAEEEVLARIEHSDLGLAFSRLSPDLQAVVQGSGARSGVGAGPSTRSPNSAST